MPAARLLALVSIAEADAAIMVWDAKFHYTSWRPVTAMRAGGNRFWVPLLPTPAFPEYVSAHSGFSGAATEMLCLFFGTDRLPFSAGSDATELPGVTKLFQSFTEAAEEAGNSRIFAGLHFRFSHVDGAAAGRAVADAVFAEALRPAGQPEQPARCNR